MKQNFEEKENSYIDQVEGRNAVIELLESGKDINKIFLTFIVKLNITHTNTFLRFL